MVLVEVLVVGRVLTETSFVVYTGRSRHSCEACRDLVGRTPRSALAYLAESEEPSDTGSQEQSLDREEHPSLKDEVANLCQKLHALEGPTPSSSVSMAFLSLDRLIFLRPYFHICLLDFILLYDIGKLFSRGLKQYLYLSHLKLFTWVKF